MLRVILFFVFISGQSFAKVKVITTTTNLLSLTQIIGGDNVSAISLTKGVQDPHYVEAKPSFMIKASKADLLVSIGMGLEQGWLPSIIRGSRNPKLLDRTKYHFISSEFITPIEVHKVKMTRADGDVHPEGNPHFMLDPLRSVEVAKALSVRLSLLDPTNKSTYAQNYTLYEKRIHSMYKKWKLFFSKTIKVVTYHKTLSYFYDQFGVSNIDVLEPKPGIPPSASHVLSLIKKVKAEKIKKIIVENYFDQSVGKRVIRDSKEYVDTKLVSVPVAVYGEEGINNLFDLYILLCSKIGQK